MKKGGRLRVDRVYPHARATVWRALTDRDLLGRWLMPNDFRPELGHEFTFETEPGPGFDGVVRCRVLAIDEPRSMTWSWRGGPIDTEVTFSLEPVAAGTRLVVVHEGFRGVKSRLVQLILGIGNRTLYGKRLPQLLDELERGVAMSPSPTDPAACMSPWQRFLIFVTGRLPGRRRGDDPPPSA